MRTCGACIASDGGGGWKGLLGEGLKKAFSRGSPKHLCMPFLQTISLPEGLAQLEQLNAAMAHLLSSTDAGVAEAARLVSWEVPTRKVPAASGRPVLLQMGFEPM